jgi:hypothetical protein
VLSFDADMVFRGVVDAGWLRFAPLRAIPSAPRYGAEAGIRAKKAARKAALRF